jgi:hypothetical protein
MIEDLLVFAVDGDGVKTGSWGQTRHRAKRILRRKRNPSAIDRKAVA